MHSLIELGIALSEAYREGREFVGEKNPLLERMGFSASPQIAIDPSEVARSTLQSGVGMVWTGTALLDLSDRLRFRNWLIEAMKRGRIEVPPAFIGPLTYMLYEAATNAEEHGLDADQQASTFRALIIAKHESPYIPPVALGANDYYRAYSNLFGESRLGWIEAVVIDSGVGIVYPRWRELSHRLGTSVSRGISAEDISVELRQLEQILNGPVTTKATWGRRINKVTPPGHGTLQLKLLLNGAKAFASVRSGRCLAKWYIGHDQRTPADIGNRPYEVEGASTSFQGTAWTLLVPVSQQLTLQL